MNWHCWIAALLLTVPITAQLEGDIAWWSDVRSGVVRDTLYLEGGLMGKWVNFKTSIYSTVEHGLSQFNFSTSFDQTSNFTDIFQSKNVIADPLQRPHTNGFMFADNDEWYSFGGQAFQHANNQTVTPLVIRDGIYNPNAAATNAPKGISTNFSPKGNRTNLYVTNGGGVSIPSESLGFYFSGLRSNTSNDMSFLAGAGDVNAPYQLVKTMLRVDTSLYAESDWAEIPLPDSVVPRAEAVLAWVPTGTRGAIVVIGGVPFPTDLYQNTNCNVTDINKISANSRAPSFMSNVSVYDVASGRWYNQATSGTPPVRLAQACAVVASSSDNSTHNIHVYGGYDGIGSTANDDVWVLSVPSFTWVKAVTGTSNHARYGHVCAKPYPNQMMVIGGLTKCRSRLNNTAFADVLDLNSLTWTGSYDPLKWSEYVVPSVISNAIKATPTASMEIGLRSLFQTKYSTSLPKWYPYTPAATSSPQPPKGPSHPNWLIPLVAVIAVTIIIAIIAILWYCRRRGRRNAGMSNETKSQSRITSWLRGQPYPAKSMRSDDETTQVETPYGIHETLGDTHYKPGTQARVAELTNESVFNTPELGNPQDGLHRSASTAGLRSTELPSSTIHYELPAEPFTIARRPVGKPRLLSSASISSNGTPIPAMSVISPSNGPITPSALSKVQSNESGVSTSPDDMALSQMAQGTAEIALSPEQTALASSSSPPTSPPAISPSSPLVSPPTTPPSQSTSNFRPFHMRNASSISSDLPDLSSPGLKGVSPREEYRRSMMIAALPDSKKGKMKADSGSGN